jgi:nucleotide-binding universal stress UspA family protein
MIAIKKLLVPTDFSEYSQFALKYAVAFAEGFAAKVYVMHVHEPYPPRRGVRGHGV